MATEKYVESLSYARNAGADLSEKLHYLAKIDTDDDVVLAGDGEAVLGVIWEAAEENDPVTVQFGGIAKVYAGATFNAGVKVASNGSGQAVLASTGEFAFGIALESADAIGQIVSVALVPQGRVA
jgi:hypothetical protein